MPHHVELKQFPRTSRSFNLSDAELAPLLAGWSAGAPFTWAELEWEPRKAKLTILRGRELESSELGQGRGWPQAQRVGEDVTEAMLAAARDTRAGGGAFREEALELLAAGEVHLGGLVSLTESRWPGRPVSERVATVEQLVWDLLHRGELDLIAGERREPVSQERWREVLASWAAWGPQEASLRRRPR